MVYLGLTTMQRLRLDLAFVSRQRDLLELQSSSTDNTLQRTMSEIQYSGRSSSRIQIGKRFDI